MLQRFAPAVGGAFGMLAAISLLPERAGAMNITHFFRQEKSE